MYINWRKKELVITIALYGPQGSGKTTMWHYIARKALHPPEEGDDTTTLYLQDIQGKRVLLNVRDTPGETEASSRRRVALYGVDGLIFVADSLKERQEANDQSLYELEEHLGTMNKTIYALPFVFQYNKRDLKGVVPVTELQKRFNPDRIFPCQATSATTGDGVVKTLQCITDLVLTTVL
jgi:hypothetical protein